MIVGQLSAVLPRDLVSDKQPEGSYISVKQNWYLKYFGITEFIVIEGIGTRDIKYILEL